MSDLEKTHMDHADAGESCDDVQPMDGPDVSEDTGAGETHRDWHAEYIRETAQSRRYRRRAQKAEAQLGQLSQRTLSDEQYARYVRLKDSAGELDAKEHRISDLEGMVRRIAATDELGRSLSACGVGSACPHGRRMLKQATDLLAERIRVDVSGEEPVVGVLDESGRVIIDSAGEPVSVQTFVSNWLAEEGSHFLPASGDTGSGAHKGLAVADGPSIESLDRDPKAKAQFIAKYGPQAYVQLARKKR